MNNKKVSVIIPIFNSEKFLKKCIESVISQNYENIEILLINDGSTDNSLDICNYYKLHDKRIKIINKKNTGVSDCRNIGISISTGKYIIFVDSDDYIHPDYIEILVNSATTKCLNLCYPHTIDDAPEYEKISKFAITKFNMHELLPMYKKNIINPPWGKLYIRDIIIKNNIRFDASISLGEDLLFNFNYLKYIDYVNVIDLKLYYYRKPNSNSLSGKYYSNMKKIQIKLLNSFHNFFSKYHKPHEINDYEMNFIGAIILNEFRNKSINKFKRIANAKKVLKNKDIQEIVKIHKQGTSIIKYVLFRYKLALTYILIIKLKEKLSNR